MDYSKRAPLRGIKVYALLRQVSGEGREVDDQYVLPRRIPFLI